IVVLLAVVVALGYFLYARRRSKSGPDPLYNEPEPRSSRFEQLLAEIQGLSLRVKSGESKGYYRKIETLVRVFLERTGQPNARYMSDEEVRKILSSGSVPQELSTRLREILDRCRQGAVNESDKLDFTA